MLRAAHLSMHVMARCAWPISVDSPIFKKGISTQIRTMIPTHFPYTQHNGIA